MWQIMSQIRFYIVAFLLSLSYTTYAQKDTSEDPEVLQMRVTNIITQSDLDHDRGNYFDAKDNLRKSFRTSLKC